MRAKTVLLAAVLCVALSAQHVLAACAATGAVCINDDDCCSGACSPLFNYCLPQ
uniref:DekiORF142 n=1 Tax=Dendrolimus kikuchii nucleopolyhedrovirus TaxID=1219875 RepID=V9LSX2_9ABAC|nr:DekiORF142 [Dendrolimus kikuchii nucleopolyhedrovirus]